MSDLPTLTGRPRRLVVRDRTYEIHPITIDDLAGLQSFIDAQFPDPFAAASRALAGGEWTVPMQQHLLRVAMEQATRRRRLIGTPEADEILMSMAGVCELLKLAIRKGDPSFSDDDARALFASMTVADLEGLLTATGMEMVLHDPKASSGTSGATGASTSRRRHRPGSTGGSSTTTP